MSIIILNSYKKFFDFCGILFISYKNRIAFLMFVVYHIIMAINCTLFEYLNKSIHSPKARKMIYFDNTISAEELVLSTHKIATFLTNLGILPQDTVAIALPNMPEAVMACYGINRIGAIANIMHPKLGINAVKDLLVSTKTKAIFMLDSIYNIHKSTLDRLQIKVILCSVSTYMCKIKGIFASIIAQKHKNITYFKDVMATNPTYMDCSFDANLPAVYIHSGGTSSSPKTVILSSIAINSVVQGIMERVHNGDPKQCQNGCVLMALPIFHCFGLTVTMHTAICHSCALLVPQFKPRNVVKNIKKYRLTHLMGVPQMYKKMLNVASFKGEKLSQISYIFCGGDVLPMPLREQFNNRMQNAGSSAKIAEGYGLTETASVFTLETLQNAHSQGSPILNNSILVVNEAGNICSTEEVGELLLHSNSLMLGYLDSQKEDVFIKVNGIKYLKSGDYGYIDGNGNLHFADRKKRTIKISAHNIFPSQVENIAKGLPMVADCVVARTLVNGKPATKMYIVFNKSYNLSNSEGIIKDAISSSISKYAVPKVFIAVDSLHRTPLGKVDYKSYEN